MISTLFASCALALLSAHEHPGPLPVARPDVVPGFPRGVRVDGRLDLSGVRDRCCVQYVVKKGDALAAIAARELGSAGRLADVLALNPELEPSRMKVGTRIWLPARAAVTEPLYLYMATWDRPSFDDAEPGQAPLKSLKPLAETDAYPHTGDVAWGIFVVDERHREGLLALAAAKDRARSVAEIQQMVKKGKLSFVLVDSHPGVVAGKAADRVVRVKETVRIVRGKDGRYAAQFERKSFDKKNRLVPHKESSGTKKQAWLLLIGVTGACWVLRRRATAPTTAAAPC